MVFINTSRRIALHKEIREMIDAFAHAAEYLATAGWDGIELHGAHGFLLAQFLMKWIIDYALNRCVISIYAWPMSGFTQPYTRIYGSVAQTAQSRTLVLIRLASTLFFLNYRSLPPSSLLHIIYIIMNSPKEVSKQERLNLAVTACQNNANKLSIRKIARQHGLSEFTLRGRLNDRQAREIAYISRQKLAAEQEDALAH